MDDANANDADAYGANANDANANSADANDDCVYTAPNTQPSTASFNGFDTTNLILFLAGRREICISFPNTHFCLGCISFLPVTTIFAMFGILIVFSCLRRQPATMLKERKTCLTARTDIPASLATSA